MPRLKVLQKISASEVWVVLTTVQYAKQEWQNRCKIAPTSEALDPFWVSIPASLPSGSKTLIKDVKTPNLSRILSKYRNRIHSAFSDLPYRACAMDYWDETTSLVSSENLCELSSVSTIVALKRYGRRPMIIDSRDIAHSGAKSILVASICSAIGATEYIADSGARSYLQSNDFDRKIKIRWQDWDGQTIAQDLSKWRNFSFINLLARLGPIFLEDHLNNPLLIEK